MLSLYKRQLTAAARCSFSAPRAVFSSVPTVTRIGDVKLSISTSGTAFQHLIPKNHLSALSPISNETLSHMRWLAQKFELGQDALLLGHPGPLRRQIVLAFAEAAGVEVEHLRLTRDTTESDLKQRRELRSSAGVAGADAPCTTTTSGASLATTATAGGHAQSVIFHDQAPVRAALHGRILLLEGLEAAERNVLPTLNNLLENRGGSCPVCFSQRTACAYVCACVCVYIYMWVCLL